MVYVLGKKVVKGKDNKTKEEKTRPSDDELREAICEILKVVDFTTVSIKFIHTNQLSLAGNLISILDSCKSAWFSGYWISFIRFYRL